jgi:cytoskeletal protein CcmA (bactofilin family)
MPRRFVATFAVLAAAVTASVTIAVTAAAPGAHADLVTYCVGTGGPVTVPNDLVVPADESCSLQGTTVTGNVQVSVRANLVIAGGTINGDVRVAGDGYLDASNATIGGEIELAAGGFGVFLRDVSSGSVTLRPRGSAIVEGFLFAEHATVEGNVVVNVGEVRLDRTTQVTGNLSTSGAYYTDVHDSFVDGTLSVLNNATGSVVCGSAVRGRATFAGNLGGVQLGPNGSLDGCASGGYWGRDVNVNNTTGGVTVDDNIVDGQLLLASNNPAAVVAANNRVRGGVVGEQGTAGARAGGRAATGPTRTATGDDRAQVRRGQAVGEAAQAGPAQL